MGQADAMKSRVGFFLAMRGMTIVELVQLSGLSTNTVRKAMENGPNGIECCTLRTIEKVATALGVRPRDLIDDCPYDTGGE